MYPREEVGPDRLQMYCEMLEDLDHEGAQFAVRRLVAKSKWFPAIAEIREEYARESTDGCAPELAWSEVLSAVSRHGRYRQPTFDDGKIALWRDYSAMATYERPLTELTTSP